MNRVIWLLGDLEVPDELEWESRDMAQLFAVITHGPLTGSHAGKAIFQFRVESIPEDA